MRERVSNRVTTIAQMGRSTASGQPTLERQRRDRRPRATEPEAEAARTADWLVSRGPVRPEAGDHRGRTPVSFPETRKDLPRGRPVDPGVSEHVGQALGYDFSSVRIHDDAAAARLTGRLGARAATFGTNIAVAPGRYRPDYAEGRRLLAHELVHVAQQQAAGPLVQLAPEGAADIGVLTLNWDVRFKQNRPTADELLAAPEVVLTPEGLSDYRALLMLMTDPQQQVQIEGSASIEGDAAENVRLSARRARWMANQIGPVRVRSAPGHKPDCPETTAGQYACGTSHAHPVADPADRRVTVRIFQPSGTHRGMLQPPSDPSPGPKPQSPPTGTVQPGQPSVSGQKGSSGSNQVSLQGGIGYTRHFYTTPAGPHDPLGEWVVQVVGAYTRQFHPDKRPGFELQFPIQVQYSLATGQWSLTSGAQPSYVLPFGGNKWQWSAFAQVLGGANLSTGSGLFQPAVGTQVMWQPTDWFNLAAQATGGLTLQKPGPASVDLGGLFVITIQH